MGLLDLNADDADLPVGLPIEVRVKAGMALLDEKHGPDWVQRIDVDTLALSNSCRCVLGQLHGGDLNSYGDGLRELDLRDESGTSAEDHGFTIGRGIALSRHWDELTTAWRLAILARRMEMA